MYQWNYGTKEYLNETYRRIKSTLHGWKKSIMIDKNAITAVDAHGKYTIHNETLICYTNENFDRMLCSKAKDIKEKYMNWPYLIRIGGIDQQFCDQECQVDKIKDKKFNHGENIINFLKDDRISLIEKKKIENNYTLKMNHFLHQYKYFVLEGGDQFNVYSTSSFPSKFKLVKLPDSVMKQIQIHCEEDIFDNFYSETEIPPTLLMKIKTLARPYYDWYLKSWDEKLTIARNVYYFLRYILKFSYSNDIDIGFFGQINNMIKTMATEEKKSITAKNLTVYFLKSLIENQTTGFYQNYILPFVNNFKLGKEMKVEKVGNLAISNFVNNMNKFVEENCFKVDDRNHLPSMLYSCAYLEYTISEKIPMIVLYKYTGRVSSVIIYILDYKEAKIRFIDTISIEKQQQLINYEDFIEEMKPFLLNENPGVIGGYPNNNDVVIIPKKFSIKMEENYNTKNMELFNNYIQGKNFATSPPNSDAFKPKNGIIYMKVDKAGFIGQIFGGNKKVMDNYIGVKVDDLESILVEYYLDDDGSVIKGLVYYIHNSNGTKRLDISTSQKFKERLHMKSSENLNEMNNNLKTEMNNNDFIYSSSLPDYSIQLCLQVLAHNMKRY